MSIRFKFKSSNEFETLDFGCKLYISIGEVRSKIMRIKKLNNLFRNDSDLVLIDAVTGQEYGDDGVEIRSGSSLIAKRVPSEGALTDFWIRHSLAAITDIDYYGILGLRKGCAYDQVKVAYDEKLGEIMKQGLEQEELTKKLDLLKESYTILSSVEDRRLYDWSLARNGNPDRYAWPFEVDITQTVTVNSPDTPPPQEPEDIEPTRLVGYFLLTWIILSITLSIALNR